MADGNLVLPAFEAAGIAQETTSQDILAAVTGLATETTLGDVYSTATGIDSTVTNIYAEATGTNSKLDSIYAEATGTNSKLDSIYAEATGTNGKLDDIYVTATGISGTVSKLRQWPYADHDAVVTSFATGTFTETVLYKTGGATGTTVGTITTVYNDISRGLPATTTYSPARVV